MFQISLLKLLKITMNARNSHRKGGFVPTGGATVHQTSLNRFVPHLPAGTEGWAWAWLASGSPWQVLTQVRRWGCFEQPQTDECGRFSVKTKKEIPSNKTNQHASFHYPLMIKMTLVHTILRDVGCVRRPPCERMWPFRAGRLLNSLWQTVHLIFAWDPSSLDNPGSALQKTKSTYYIRHQ